MQPLGTRRRLACASVLVAVVASSCAISGSGGDGGSATPRTTASTTTTTVALPPAVRWQPSPNEVEPGLKTVAADALMALLTYELGGGSPAAARTRIATLPAEPTIADTIAPLLAADSSSAADVVYPQLGGFTGRAASVMAVTRIRRLAAGEITTSTRTIDVRLELRSGAWRVTALGSLGGERIAIPDTLPPIAKEVLGHPRIDMPESGQWDIARGLIDERILRILLDLARDREIRVTVLSAGHPLEVFGTNRASNHIKGRAVDVWFIDGLVAEQQAPTSPLRPVVQQLLDSGVTELGAPFDIDGARDANFTNTVHRDHLHIGFDR